MEQTYMAVVAIVEKDFMKGCMEMGVASEAEDWYPEDGYEHDPLDVATLDDRWTQFYVDRFNAQMERELEKGRAVE
jgi:hypothetical protein